MKKTFSHLLYRLQRKLHHGQKNERLERGQVLVIVTLAVIGLVAAVGLTVDVGLLYLNHGKLRRAVDAAALAATAQFREGYGIDDYQKTALEFLELNGIQDPTATVEICDPANPDPAICTDPPRKLVRVTATTTMKLAFLPVIGIREATVSATAVSEAASMDVVLVIDTSESMTYGVPDGDPMRDPSQCNPGNDCDPFKKVKKAADEFVKRLNFPYDRVAIVTFDRGGRVELPFTGDLGTVRSAIKDLDVFTADVCKTTYEDGTCRDYVRFDNCLNGLPWANGDCDNDIFDEAVIDNNGDGIGDQYLRALCPVFYGPDPYKTGNPDTCGTTSIGRGLFAAGNEFANPNTYREESLWVVILLTDGAANGPAETCPHGTWEGLPFCRDLQLSRHCSELYTPDVAACEAAGGVLDTENYDADDYARDMADFVAKKQNALIFSIGLGDLVRTSVPRARLDADGKPTSEKCESDEPTANCMGDGEQFLRYAAEEVGGGKYYFAPTGNQLEKIFLDIASNLATRLTQ